MSLHRKNLTDVAVVDRLDAILSKANPCDIKVVSGVATCRDGKPCCRGCKHLGASGCTVLAVGCKFYFCNTAWDSMPPAVQEEIRALGAAYTGELRFRFDGDSLAKRGRPPFIW